jgi:hypothetical protein
MIQESLGWILVFGALVALAVAYAVPATRPYAKKYWWFAVALVVVGIAFILLRKKPGRDPNQEAREEGEEILEENLGAVDAIVDYALEKQVAADAELTRRRLESDAARERFDAQVAAIEEVDDSLERRKALINLVEDYS